MVIDVVNAYSGGEDREEIARRRIRRTFQMRFRRAGGLQQLEFLGPANGRPAAVDAKFGVEVLGVGADRIQRHDE